MDTLFALGGPIGVLHTRYSVCIVEQECHLTKNQVNDSYHLDQKPGYKVGGKGTSCSDTSKLETLEDCEEARDALDWRVYNVTLINKANSTSGCYRQQKGIADYRSLHNESSYLWYYNEPDDGEYVFNSDPNNEPICKG